jgi:hypothetical protein
VQDAVGLLGDEVDAWLVVKVLDDLPLEVLLGVLLLLQLEDVLVEVELQCLVGVVDAQLLEAV